MPSEAHKHQMSAPTTTDTSTRTDSASLLHWKGTSSWKLICKWYFYITPSTTSFHPFWSVFGTILGVEPRTSHVLHKHSTTQSRVWPTPKFLYNCYYPFLTFKNICQCLACMYVCIPCACLVFWRWDGGIGFPGAGVTDDSELPQGARNCTQVLSKSHVSSSHKHLQSWGCSQGLAH